MHYSANGFVVGSLPTLVSPVPIGQREGLSKGDIGTIHFIYNQCSASFDAPLCMASREQTQTHLIPYGKRWSVEFNSVYTAGSMLRIGVDSDITGIEVLRTGEGTDTATTQVYFTPSVASQGATFYIAASFEDRGRSVTCRVEVKVADSDSVCLGLPATDPNVCSGRGVCVSNPLEPCQCNAGFGGLDCLGYSWCPKNLIDAFDDTQGVWVPIGDDSGKDTSFFAKGGGSLRIQGLTMGNPNTGYLELQKNTKPERVSFYIAAMQIYDGTAPGLQLMGGDGSTSCLQLSYLETPDKVWSIEGVSAGVVAERGRFYHFDLHIDWVNYQVNAYINGKTELLGVPFGSTGGCVNGLNEGIKQVVFFGSGWLDEFHLWCTSYVKMSGSVLSSQLHQSHLVAGGKSITLTLVGDYDEWIDTPDSKDKLLASMQGTGPYNAGWNAFKSTMLGQDQVTFNGASAVIGPFLAAPLYGYDAQEMVNFELTAGMFRSGKTPEWLPHDLEFQIPGVCSLTLRKSFDSEVDKTGAMGIDTVVKKEGAGAGLLSSFVQSYEAGDVQAEALRFFCYVETGNAQFQVQLMSTEKTSTLDFWIANGEMTVTAGSTETLLNVQAMVWYEVEFVFDWDAQTFDIFVDKAQLRTAMALPFAFINIRTLNTGSIEPGTRIDELTLACRYRKPVFVTSPEKPLIGLSVNLVQIHAGSERVSVEDEIAIVPVTTNNCLDADALCAPLGACSKTAGAMFSVLEGSVIIWNAGTLPKLNTDKTFAVCIKSVSTGAWVQLDGVLEVVRTTPAPATDAPPSFAPRTTAPDTETPPSTLAPTSAPKTSAPATFAPLQPGDTNPPSTQPPATLAPLRPGNTNPPATFVPARPGTTNPPATFAPLQPGDTNPPNTQPPVTFVPLRPGNTNPPATFVPARPGTTNPPATFVPLRAGTTNPPNTQPPATWVPLVNGITNPPQTQPPATWTPLISGTTNPPDTQPPSTWVPLVNGTTNPPNTQPPATWVPLVKGTTNPPETQPPATWVPLRAGTTNPPNTQPPSTWVPLVKGTTNPPNTQPPATWVPLRAGMTNPPATGAPLTGLPEGATYSPSLGGAENDDDDDDGDVLWIVLIAVGSVALLGMLAGCVYFVMKPPPAQQAKSFGSPNWEPMNESQMSQMSPMGSASLLESKPGAFVAGSEGILIESALL